MWEIFRDGDKRVEVWLSGAVVFHEGNRYNVVYLPGFGINEIVDVKYKKIKCGIIVELETKSGILQYIVDVKSEYVEMITLKKNNKMVRLDEWNNDEIEIVSDFDIWYDIDECKEVWK